MQTTTLPAPWGYYLQLQQTAGNSFTIDPPNLGHEDALTAILDDNPASPLAESEAFFRRFNNLSRNRRAKYCQRKRLERGWICSMKSDVCPPNQYQSLARAELTEVCRGGMSSAEWGILWKLAEGHTYGEVA